MNGNWIEGLSDRRQECLSLMLLGYGYKEIAKMMFITVGTVGNHASYVLAKADAPDRVTLILKHYGLPNWMDQ